MDVDYWGGSGCGRVIGYVCPLSPLNGGPFPVPMVWGLFWKRKNQSVSKLHKTDLYITGNSGRLFPLTH